MRFALGNALTQWLGKGFPYATFIINIMGSFLMGLLIALLVAYLPRGRELHALLAIGALGGFTTFSSFAYESYMLLERGQWVSAGLYIGGSVALSILGFFLGLAVVRLLFT